MNPQEVTIYLILGAAGGAAGFIRFGYSKRTWDLRTVTFSSLFGGMLGSVAAMVSYGENVDANFWKAFALACFMGFVQPKIHTVVWEPLVKPLVTAVLTGLLKAVAKSAGNGDTHND